MAFISAAGLTVLRMDVPAPSSGKIIAAKVVPIVEDLDVVQVPQVCWMHSLHACYHETSS